jgi:uncharacterized protein involved in exopolysaccharide biosynthesis
MQSFKMLAGWLSATGLAAGFLASFTVAPRYTSHASIELRTANALALLDQASFKTRSRSALATLINDPRLNLYPDERRRSPFEDVEDGMRRDLRLSSTRTADPAIARLSIDFTYRDPALAQAALKSMVGSIKAAINRRLKDASSEAVIFDEKYLAQVALLEDHIAALEKRFGIAAQPENLRPGNPPEALEILEVARPSFPERPVSPSRPAFAAAGFGAGIGAALVIALFRRRNYPIPGPIPS